jgi:hypothetical protein
MKLLSLAVIAIALSTTAALAQRAVPPRSPPLSKEALYIQCRNEIGRKYGQPGVQYSNGPKYRVFNYTFITLIDQCVASGGRVN